MIGIREEVERRRGRGCSFISGQQPIASSKIRSRAFSQELSIIKIPPRCSARHKFSSPRVFARRTLFVPASVGYGRGCGRKLAQSPEISPPRTGAAALSVRGSNTHRCVKGQRKNKQTRGWSDTWVCVSCSTGSWNVRVKATSALSRDQVVTPKCFHFCEINEEHSTYFILITKNREF